MKLFHFYRSEDETGVSGTGPVVEGVQFTNGWCALRWISNKSSICFYQSLDEVKAIHGHGGKTEIVIHDFDPLMKPKVSQSNERFEILLEIIEEASRLLVLADDPEQSQLSMTQALRRLQTLFQELSINLPQKIPKSA
jgi:hypothetical protein